MNEGLTPEVAESVYLPLNPVSRHIAATAILSDVEMVGDTHVMINPSPGEPIIYNGHNVIALHTISPFVGRRTLKKVAQTFAVMNEKYGI